MILPRRSFIMYTPGAGGSRSRISSSEPWPGVTFAGTGKPVFDGDGHGRMLTSLYWPLDLDFAPDGRAYLLDWQNHRVRRIEADGRVVTVDGTDLGGDGPPDQSHL